MRFFRKLFTPLKIGIPDEEFIRQLKGGGTQARKAIARFYDSHLFKARLMWKNFYYLEEEDILFAYATAVTQIVAKIEQDKYNGKANLSTFLQHILKKRCIDLFREKKREWKNKSLEEKKEELFFEEEELEGQEAISNPEGDFVKKRVALIVSMEEEQIPELKNPSPNAEATLISREFIEEIKCRIGGKPWAVLLCKAEGYNSREIAAKFNFNTPHSATQSCSAYKKNLFAIIRDMRAEGW